MANTSHKLEYHTLASEFSKPISCNNQVRILKMDLTLRIKLLSSINLSLTAKSIRISKEWLRQISFIRMLLAMVPQSFIAILTTRASSLKTSNCKGLLERAHRKNSTMLDKTSQTATQKKPIKLVTMRRWSTLHQKWKRPSISKRSALQQIAASKWRTTVACKWRISRHPKSSTQSFRNSLIPTLSAPSNRMESQMNLLWTTTLCTNLYRTMK